MDRRLLTKRSNHAIICLVGKRKTSTKHLGNGIYGDLQMIFRLRRKRSRRSTTIKAFTLVGSLMVCSLTLSASVHAESDPASAQLDFDLKDQFGELIESDRLRGEHLLLIGGDRKAGDVSREWTQAVRSSLGETPEGGTVEILRVADLRGVPSMAAPMVSKKMRSRYAESVLLDWSGVLAGRFDFQPGVVNIVLIHRSGSVVMKHQAVEPDQNEIQKVVQAVSDLAVESSSDVGSWQSSGVFGPGL